MSEMTPAEFIKTLKVGDKVEFVVMHNFYARRRRSLASITVLRFTPTQVVCADSRHSMEIRYRLDNGSCVGDCYDKFPLPVDAETRAKVIEEMKGYRLSEFLSDLEWGDLSLEKLRRVMSIVKEES